MTDLLNITCISIILIIIAYDHVRLSKSISSEQLIVDTTPPTLGHISSTSLTALKWLAENHLRVHVTNFIDDESGIDYYVATIGSSRQYADVIPETTYRNDLMEIDLEDAPLLDGHTYYLGIKVCVL